RYLVFLSGTASTGMSTLSLHDALPIYFAAHDAGLHAIFRGVDERNGGVELGALAAQRLELANRGVVAAGLVEPPARAEGDLIGADRKSTRLNSSHVKISYAVFCLKKKK